MSGESGGRQDQGESSSQPRETQPPGGGQQSDTAQDPLQAWTVFSATLFAIAGFAVGVLMILLDAIDESFVELDAGGAPTGGGGGGIELGSEFANLISVTFTYPVLVFAVGLAVFVGAGLAYRTEHDDDTAFRVAAASAAAGAALFVIVSVILFSITLDGLSVNFAGLLINAVVTAIAAGGAAVGGVWTGRNQTPE